MERLRHVVQINMLLGAWLIVAPFALGYSASTTELLNDVALGAMLIACSLSILSSRAGQIVLSALQLPAALWLIAAPFYLRYSTLSRPYNNDLIVGILALIVSTTTVWILMSPTRVGPTD